MLDISVSYNRYKFIGHEFLTWLWFTIENQPERVKAIDKNLGSLTLGNRIVIENRRNDEVLEAITIKGDDAGLEEGILSLKKGAVVTEINLIQTIGDKIWSYTLKGESFNISSLKTPVVGQVETGDDIEGAVIEKVYLYDQVIELVQKLFKTFIKKRVSDSWPQTVHHIKKWISS
ncbi:MAG: hypothetical protein DRP51_05800 [Candidatus Zixiibacteriota bacterium]|nr:MAG: hypothetical protein DRP51_05800 [candidate division Zixibacteria bacterium]